MIDLLIRSARIAGSPDSAPVDLQVDRGVILEIGPASSDPVPARTIIEARGALLSAPYVEPHIHLDTALTAGEPRWNVSGTLWEGIACWSERKALLSRKDVIDRAEEILRWQVANGVLFVRSHVDVTDPKLEARDALLEVRDRVKEVVELQIVAFPQEGICSFPDGEKPVSYTHLTLPTILLCVDLGGRRIIKKKKKNNQYCRQRSKDRTERNRHK